MVFHMVPVAMVAMAMLVGTSVMAGSDSHANTHDGTVVSVNGNGLVMTTEEGQRHSHTLATDAKVTVDGRVCKASDLKSGTKIRVTTKGAGNDLVCRIEAIDRDQGFASDASNRQDGKQEGKLVRFTGNKLVMTGKDGKEHTRTVASDARVTLDGEACKAADLSSGARIRVNSAGDTNTPVDRIEALDKNQEFASL